MNNVFVAVARRALRIRFKDGQQPLALAARRQDAAPLWLRTRRTTASWLAAASQRSARRLTRRGLDSSGWTQPAPAAGALHRKGDWAYQAVV